MTTAAHRWEYLPSGSTLVERYEIDREIGRGGFSVVYAAFDHTLGQRVAIKLLVPPPASAEVTRERLRREVIAVRTLSHEHIVSVHDFVDDGDRSFLVMRLVDGPNLAQHVAECGALTVQQVVRLGDEVARALTAAHENGILHRDVKPQNILLDPLGNALLTDFGSARIDDQHTITRTGVIIGTPGYTPPNVVAGHRPDVRDDVYALGMTLAFTVTGEGPALQGSPESRRHKDVDFPGAPSWLLGVIHRATAPDPIDRFPTAASLRLALLAGADGKGARFQEFDAARCLVCGSPELLGKLVCDFCQGSEGQADDALLVAHGRDRAIARVPMAVSDLALARLRATGLHAVAVPTRLAWTAIPRATWLLAALVAVAGVGSAWLGVMTAYWPTVLMAGGLLLSAERTIRQPRKSSDPRSWLPSELHQRMITTLTTLSRGTARSLFCVFTGRVRAFAGLAERHAGIRVFRAGVEELYAAACDAALDLDDADRMLLAPAGHGGDRHTLERSREQIVFQFLSATAQVEHMCALALDSVDERQFESVARELSRQVSALREVNRLVST